jgi:carboxyl-terminal processing protease
MRTRLLFYSFLIFSFVGCNEDNPPALSLFAQSFLDEMLNVMEKNSINKKTIDWEEFRTKVYAKAAGAETLTQLYPAITEALTLLGDNHSVFIGPSGNTISAHTITCNTQTIVKPVVPYNIGYVRVNQFGGGSTGSAAVAFAEEIQQQIKSQGNMWPMVAGIGPILGEGTAGYFIGPDGLESSWGYLDGASVNEGTVISHVGDPYELVLPNPKVAVLFDNGIASSGEVMAISFVGREKTKSFGSPTCGLSTANSGYTLSGNCTLVLTIAYLADRDKNLFGVPVPPDQVSTNESIVQDAVAWIQE